MQGAILWVKKYRNLRLTRTISHFTKLITDRELTQADQKFWLNCWHCSWSWISHVIQHRSLGVKMCSLCTAASVLCTLSTQIGKFNVFWSSDPQSRSRCWHWIVHMCSFCSLCAAAAERKLECLPIQWEDYADHSDQLQVQWDIPSSNLGWKTEI